MMRQLSEEKADFCSVFQELKSLGLKVPKLKKFISSIPKQGKSVPLSNNKIFGINITEQEKIEVENYLLPKFIVISTNYLKQYMNREIGLFRKAGSVSRQRDLRVKLERGDTIENSEPNDVASLLKQWLRELPETLIPVYLHDLFIRCLNLQDEDNKIAAILLCCHLLPFDHFCTLKHLFVFLSEIAQNSEKNKMGSHNLALIMAPNIFVMGPNSIDKSSNDLVQQHTSVIELLIDNAHRIQSPCSSTHLAEAEALKCDTDLETSIVLPDYSPTKIKKKRKSGGVQDLFSGFKKLVRQNSVSPGRKRSYQGDCNSDTRSALKRKADEEHSPSPLKKLATASSVLHDESSCHTPNSKISKTASSANEKSRKAHSRGKSFNLLKRKEKKRQKSEKSNSSASKLSISTPNPFQENLVLSLQIQSPAENMTSFSTPPSISPINFQNLFASNSGFMKKSYSDCFLITNNEKYSNKMFSVSSEGCLPAENIPSPFDKLTLKVDDQIDSLKVPKIILSQAFSCEKIPESLKTGNSVLSTLEKSVSDTKIFRSNIEDVNDGAPSSISVESTVTSMLQSEEKVKRNSSITRREAFVVKPKNSRKNTINQLKRADSIRISRLKNNQLKISHQNDTSIIDSKIIQKLNSNPIVEQMIPDKKANKNHALSNIQDSVKISKSRENLKKNSLKNNTENISIIDGKSFKKSDSNSITDVFSDVKVNENNSSSNDKRRTKRNVRNASIIRGRPNTVRTGLPNDVCSRYSSDSFSYSNKHKAVSVSSSVDNDLFINVVQKSDLDLSITNQIQNLTLSSPMEAVSVKEDEFKREVADFYDQIIISLGNSVSKTELTDCNDEFTNSSSVTETEAVRNLAATNIVNEVNMGNIMVKVEEPEPSKTDVSMIVSKRKSRNRLGNKCDSKVQKPKKSSKVSRINSFPDSSATTKSRKAEKLRAVKSSSPRKSCEKICTSSDNTDKENHYSEESQLETHLDVKNARVMKNSTPELESIKTDDTKMQSKRKSRERLCSNSDSKVHKTKKKSVKVSRINSFPGQASTIKQRKVEKLRAVKSSSPRKSCEKGAKISENTDKENQCYEESVKQTYLDVKTPKNKCESPEQWFSGRKFLEAEEAVQQEVCDHKRESIAMILRNNRGHVREKASIYEPGTRTTPMLLRSGTPCGRFCDTQYSNMQSSQKKSTSTRSTRSTRRNSPLPLPPIPIFFEPSPAPNHPLKEVTNLSYSEDIFFTPPSEKKSFNSSQNDENSSKKKNKKCTLKPKMNSYSGHTPFKLPVDRNKASRCQSSPNRLSPAYAEKYYCSSPILKAKSALSMEKLKSDELLDEWNCEM